MLGCSHVSLWKFIMWTIDPRSGKLIRFIGSTSANLIISQKFWSSSCFHDIIIHSVQQHFIRHACWCSASSSTHLRQFHHMKSIVSGVANSTIPFCTSIRPSENLPHKHLWMEKFFDSV